MGRFRQGNKRQQRCHQHHAQGVGNDVDPHILAYVGKLRLPETGFKRPIDTGQCCKAKAAIESCQGVLPIDLTSDAAFL